MNKLRFRKVTAIPLLGILIYGLSVFAPAHAETTNCTAITVLPAVITAQGVYCLTGNLSTSMTSGNAIEIQTNNVTIDLNGFKLGGLGAGDGTNTTGIFADQRKNITIKNGIIRGFYFGIFLDDPFPYTTSSGHVVNDILADQNTVRAIVVAGVGNTVRRNTVVDTGGSTQGSSATGIYVLGSGAKVTNNSVSTTTAISTGVAFGMLFSSADYSLVANNTVTDTVATGTGSSYAIRILLSAGIFARDNNLANAQDGLSFLTSTGIYKDNLTFDVTLPFPTIFGTDGGGNVSAP